MLLIIACDSRYAVAPFSTFKKLGIPGPAPWPFVGNLPEISKKVIIFIITSVIFESE